MGYKRGGKYKNQVYGRYTRIFIALLIIANTLLFVNNVFSGRNINSISEFLLLLLIIILPLSFAIKIILRAYGYIRPSHPREDDEDYQYDEDDNEYPED